MNAPWIVGNWKLHGDRPKLLQFSQVFADRKQSIALSVPATLLGTEYAIALGAQDVSAHKHGAYTGEISAEMYLETGAKFSLIGHSERRQYHGETDASVNAKVLRCLSVNLLPVICVGETESEFDAGRSAEVVRAQLLAALDGVASDAEFVVAYEPVWAIGTGKSATAEIAQAVHAGIRATLASICDEFASKKILYGGSVKPENAKELLAQPDINGALVGGASLEIDSFAGIVAAAEEN
ncbi:MAG: triose-phosphate isomerase [Gammaproteobacteria bacterium]|nr:triose-phosphate isomerase [Gammaproteobacteria bacterium]